MKFLAVLGGLAMFCGIVAMSTVLKPPTWPCWVRGHDNLLMFGDHEIYLRCCTCQQRSKGWQMAQRTERRA
jgi:hypothetical protein